MAKYIMCGIDLHDESLLTKTACDRKRPETRSFRNTPSGRRRLIEHLRDEARRCSAKEIWAAYEASAQGYGLHDELEEAGIRCEVLAPTKLQHTPKSRRLKTDEKDAERVLEALRGHLLAGNALPACWVPDQETRDDRELVRARLDAGGEISALKAALRTLLKRNKLDKPEEAGEAWSRPYRAWLIELAAESSPLGPGARARLGSLLRRLQAMEQEIAILDEQVRGLSRSERHRQACARLCSLKGVGVLTAMVFLTEMGRMGRFQNRRQVAAYMGVAPSSHETGEGAERKGHITRQGSPRLRKVLCQAAWARVRSDRAEGRWYKRVVDNGNAKKRKKLALVGVMRRLAILMWHEASAETPPLPSPQRGEAPASASGPAPLKREAGAGAPGLSRDARGPYRGQGSRPAPRRL